jgi:hypothetical protein
MSKEATGNALLWLPLIGALMRLFGRAPAHGDNIVTVVFLVLIAALSALAALPPPAL